MSDSKTEALAGRPSLEPELRSEIAQAMGSIWQRRAGVRPSAVNIEVDGDVIRCLIEEGDADDPKASEPAEGNSTESNTCRHEVTAAVARITHRNVSALIAKRDAKTGVATQTLILERKRVKN